MKPNDPPEARRLRARLMRNVASRGQYDQRVLDVMAKTPRHWFVEGPLEDAYRDHPRPIGWGQTTSQPTIVAIMTDALRLQGNERVLEIGTGSGYQAAVLAQLAREVFTIETVPELADHGARAARRARASERPRSHRGRLSRLAGRGAVRSRDPHRRASRGTAGAARPTPRRGDAAPSGRRRRRSAAAALDAHAVWLYPRKPRRRDVRTDGALTLAGLDRVP